MGEVYRAVDTRLRRKVALKVLRPDRERPDAVDRLFREARAAAALTHPNTVAIHDLGESDGLFYIVMELVSGMPLLAYVGDDRVPLARKLRWCVDVARALVCAHKAGVLHRDVKPSNVMVSDEDVAKVLDFGLAKPIDPKSVDFRTQAGQIVGTLRYMAPEQLAGAEADARSDQFAFGVTAYELLSGTYPGGHPLGAPRPLDELVAGFPKDGALVVARTMKRSPDERFRSMADVLTALEDVASRRPVRVSLLSSPAASHDATPAAPDATPAGHDATPAGGRHDEDAVTPRRSARPSIPDTVRDPGGELAPTSEDATATVQPPPGDGGAAPDVALDKTLPGGEALDQRRAAHARAHEAARTLLSRKAPSGLIRLVDGFTTTTAKMQARARPSAGPPTLVSGTPRAHDAPPPGVQPAGGAAAATGGATVDVAAAASPAASSPPTRGASPGRTRAAVALAAAGVAVVGFAAFAGTYLGAQRRPVELAGPAATNGDGVASLASAIATAPSEDAGGDVAEDAEETTAAPPLEPEACSRYRAAEAAGRAAGVLDALAAQCKNAGGSPTATPTPTPRARAKAKATSTLAPPTARTNTTRSSGDLMDDR